MGPTKGSSPHRRTNYFHHCTSIHSPTASEQLAELRAYNGQQVNKGTMYRKCTKNVQKMHKMCTAGAQWAEHTGVEWGGACVPILLSSLVSQIPQLSVFTIFQLPFNCSLSDHPSANFQLLFNCDQTQCQNFNGSSQFPICFYHPNPSH